VVAALAGDDLVARAALPDDQRLDDAFSVTDETSSARSPMAWRG
jgi:hypothetical protein